MIQGQYMAREIVKHPHCSKQQVHHLYQCVVRMLNRAM